MHLNSPPSPRLRRASCFAPQEDANPAKRLGAKQDGGEGRTRTFEAMRRLIYSQLPLPLGTLPLSQHRDPSAETAEIRPWMTLKPRTRSRAPDWARLWGKHHGKVNQRRQLNTGHWGAQIAIIRNP